MSRRPSAPATREPRPLRVPIKPCEGQAQRATDSPVISTEISRTKLLSVDRCFSVKPIGVNFVCLQAETNVRGCWGSSSACGGVGAQRSTWRQTVFCAAPGHGKGCRDGAGGSLCTASEGRLPAFHDNTPNGSVPVLTIKAFLVCRFAWLGKWPWCSAN